MKNVTILGDNSFTLGFSMIGLATLNNPTAAQIQALMLEPSTGLLVLQKILFDTLEEDLRQEIIASIEPVCVILSKENNQAELRNMIIKSIGVDLLKEK